MFPPSGAKMAWTLFSKSGVYFPIWLISAEENNTIINNQWPGDACVLFKWMKVCMLIFFLLAANISLYALIILQRPLWIVYFYRAEYFLILLQCHVILPFLLEGFIIQFHIYIYIVVLTKWQVSGFKPEIFLLSHTVIWTLTQAGSLQGEMGRLTDWLGGWIIPISMQLFIYYQDNYREAEVGRKRWERGSLVSTWKVSHTNKQL